MTNAVAIKVVDGEAEALACGSLVECMDAATAASYKSAPGSAEYVVFDHRRGAVYRTHGGGSERAKAIAKSDDARAGSPHQSEIDQLKAAKAQADNQAQAAAQSAESASTAYAQAAEKAAAAATRLAALQSHKPEPAAEKPKAKKTAKAE